MDKRSTEKSKVSFLRDSLIKLNIITPDYQMRILRVIAREVTKQLLLPVECRFLIKNRALIRTNRIVKTHAMDCSNIRQQAIQHGRIEILESQIQAGKTINNGISICEHAAIFGQIRIIKWARANGCPWDEDTCTIAADSGHLKTLQWLRANGCPWDKWTCANAAENGHLEILQWARANGCPWDAWTCAWAAEKGHLSTLQWARANGCRWDRNTCKYAVQKGHLVVLQWLNTQDCPCRQTLHSPE